MREAYTAYFAVSHSGRMGKPTVLLLTLYYALYHESDFGNITGFVAIL